MFKFQFIKNLFFGKKTFDPALLEELEGLLLAADVGVAVTEKLIKLLTEKLTRKELRDADAAFRALQEALVAILLPVEKPLPIPSTIKPFVILMVGVNGAGKTTTIGKLAAYYKNLGQSVLLAAGDTYRAAAIEQLAVWGERLSIPLVAQASGSDAASVIFDAFSAARARGVSILLADTAGRLHTQSPLIAELAKIKRVLQKQDVSAPHEVLLVLDATFGQNALVQVKQFQEAIGVTGLILTKCDGTAKGGTLFAIADQTGLPIRFIGTGEAVSDLKPFHAEAFVQLLLA